MEMGTAAEEVYKIHGTDLSFLSNHEELDEMSVEMLRQIAGMDLSGVEVTDNALVNDPQNLPVAEGLFLSRGSFYWTTWGKKWTTRHGQWNPVNVYGIRCRNGLGYGGIKTSYVYHNGNDKTNWIMNVYYAIAENSIIKSEAVQLCHVFQSDNYDPRPKHIPDSFDFDETALASRVAVLEYLMKKPKSFNDFYEFDERYSIPDSKPKANGNNLKRADVWDNFKVIKVVGPGGVVLLNLAICNRCSVVYQTGKGGKNNGTTTLNEHRKKCCSQHHVAGNPQPQEAHRQMP